MTINQTAVGQCPVCDRRGRHPLTLDGRIYRCDACDFGWAAGELPPPAELYDERYHTTDGYRDYFACAADRRFESALRLRWLTAAARPASLVEAGCAGGYFLEAARHAGIAASGVEICGAAVRFARKRLGVPVRHGPFESVVLPGPVAAVCAFGVLEHVEDPWLFLSVARRVLAPGGWLALEVPNIEAAAARRLGAAWPHLRPRYHRWHFSPGSLTRLVTRSGFEVVARDTVFSRFYHRWPGRLARARELLFADWMAARSPRISHPRLGDLLRLVARRPTRETL